jgi:hypothetical protein
MTEIPPELQEAEALLKEVESLLEEKKDFKDSPEYKEAQKIVEEVKAIVDPETRQRFIDRDPGSAILRLRKARKDLKRLG